MRVAEIMTMGVQTVPATMPAAQAGELMKRKRFHHLIVTEGSNVVGVLSDRDVRSGGGVRARALVAELMTSPVVTIDPDATMQRAANVMRGRTIGCIPVVEDGRLVGIVTVSDLLELVGRGAGRLVRGERAALHYKVPHRKQRRSGGKW